eukprot:gene8802-8981_t
MSVEGVNIWPRRQKFGGTIGTPFASVAFSSKEFGLNGPGAKKAVNVVIYRLRRLVKADEFLQYVSSMV